MPDGGNPGRWGSNPPLIHGTARLAGLAYRGWTLDQLLAAIGPAPRDAQDRAGWLMDRSLAHALSFQPEAAASLQQQAFGMGRVFRLLGPSSGLRLLALMAPGNLMVNAPLDFLTQEAGIRLDLAFTDAAGALPDGLPGHDVAMVAVSESAPGHLAALLPQLRTWPRPVLNDPARIARLTRDGVAEALAGLPGLATAPTMRVSRAALRRQPLDTLLPGGRYPVLLRPLHGHAGDGLMKLDDAGDLAQFLLGTPSDAFYLSQYVDYRSTDGWFHKYRIAFVDGAPFLCHMAASEHWMVHYLNAGMADSAAKRAAEASAMAGFDTGFARRHAGAFAALCDVFGLDYVSIDCAETAEGALLVFEADVAAIIHSMDDPVLYPYKRPAMQRCYDAFAAMLHRRAPRDRPD